MPASALGKYIEDRRLQLRLSRVALAESLTQNGYECTEGAINHWEHGRAKPPIDNPQFARALSRALDVMPSELIRATGMIDAASPDLVQRLLAGMSPNTLLLLERASPEQIERLDHVIRLFLADN